MGEVVPSQTARLTTARLRMTEVIAAVPEKDDGSASAHVVPVSAPGVRLRRFVRDSLLDGDGFELPVPLATERLSCRLDALGGVLFGELGFGLTNHQDREGDGCQHSEAE